MSGSLWVRVIRKNKILRDVVVPCPEGDWAASLVEACRALDLGAPLVAARHGRDFAQFRQARFLPEHFMEHVSFDRLEAELFDPDETEKRREVYR